MKFQTILKTGAIISAVFGIALLLAPNALNALYQAPPMNGPGVYNSRGYGAGLLGFAVMNWSASGASSLNEARHVVLGTLVYLVLGALAALYMQLTSAEIAPAAWLNVVIFGVLAAGYARLQFSGTDRPMGA